MEYTIVCVGAGGTGGNFLKELGRFLMFYSKPNTRWELYIIDGDTVEERNRERQPFFSGDIASNKAAAVAEGLTDCFGLKDVHAHGAYLDSYAQLRGIIGNAGGWKGSVLLLIGCVDNHRARQVMHEAFLKTPNVIYIDAANEYEEGEVVVGIRIGKKEIAPPRGFYFPEVLTSTEKRASELSCGAINVHAPQHLVTNLAAAQHVLSFVVKSMNHKAEGGILHFNPFAHYCRFDRWTAEMQAKKEADEKKAVVGAKDGKKRAPRGRKAGKKVAADGK